MGGGIVWRRVLRCVSERERERGPCGGQRRGFPRLCFRAERVVLPCCRRAVPRDRPRVAGELNDEYRSSRVVGPCRVAPRVGRRRRGRVFVLQLGVAVGAARGASASRACECYVPSVRVPPRSSALGCLVLRYWVGYKCECPRAHAIL